MSRRAFLRRRLAAAHSLGQIVVSVRSTSGGTAVVDAVHLHEQLVERQLAAAHHAAGHHEALHALTDPAPERR